MKLNFHLLTAFPPHNVNRDEDGRPKTALYGSVLRGRISSQAKKRAMRFSSHFSDLQRATRTRELGVLVFKKLSGAGISEDLAAWTALATLFAVGSGAKAERKKAQELLKPKAPEVTKVRDRFGFDEAGAREHVVLHALRSEQGLVVSTRELERLNAELESLIEAHRAAADGFDGTVGEWVERVCKDGLLDAEAIDEDTALFGRMVAANPTYNHEAAATVSHAVTTHEFTVEGDYFSAGEELNELRETGAAITSYAFYGGGVYYLHSVLDLARLTAGLNGDDARVRRALRGYLDGLVFAQPGGKRNSYASDVAAGYVVVERGTHPSVNALTAFLAPVRPGRDQDLMAASIHRLRDYLSAVRAAYGFDGDTQAFNGHPAARQGNAPPDGEVWTLGALHDFVAATPLPEAAG